jgi:hypothetical protein
VTRFATLFSFDQTICRGDDVKLDPNGIGVRAVNTTRIDIIVIFLFVDFDVCDIELVAFRANDFNGSIGHVALL